MPKRRSEPKLNCSVYNCPNNWVVHLNNEYLCRAHADADKKDWHAITQYITRKKLMAPVQEGQWYDKT
jgi:hypothetical protein